MPETLDSRALRAVSDAVVTIAAEHRFEPVLEKLADAARQLADARYAAIGVPDGEGGFSHFITSGMSQKQYDAIGDLPRQHGLLGAMLETPRSQRFPNIQAHPRFEGWPDAHPSMRSFLGVPIVTEGEVIGAFYLTDKKGPRGAVFDDADQELIETLAAHAAVAIQNARLYERSRELTVVEERNRLARELHDAVNQTLFSVSLTADAAALLVESDPEKAKEQLGEVRELVRAAMAEMRSLIFELRPADVAADGLAATLQKHVDVLRRVYGANIELDVDGGPEQGVEIEREVFRIVQEALANALKHAGAEHLRVRLRANRGRLLVTVEDDGAGFDPGGPQARRHLGLISMYERAEALGGTLEVHSAPGAGTTVQMEIELDGQHPRSDR
jgi:signal transduction histidine kinase